MSLYVPDFTGDEDTLTIAIMSAEAGWFVGPIRPEAGDGKHAGSVLGTGWPEKTSRDPKVIAGWFAGRNLGLFWHVGRSGAWAADVDHPEQVPAELSTAIEVLRPPTQQTRPDEDPGRIHALFHQPPGRDLGNGRGQLGTGWGECRGRNGIIVVGGRRRWLRTGPLPELSVAVARLLPDYGGRADTATPAEVEDFLADHDGGDHPGLLTAVVADLAHDLSGGTSRHEAGRDRLCQAMREARAGLYSARKAIELIEDAYARHRQQDRRGGRAATDLATAREEFAKLARYAVGAAKGDDPVERRAAVLRRVGPAPRSVNDGNRPPRDPSDGADGTAGVNAGLTSPAGRAIVTTPLSDIKPRRVRWLWEGRLALGTLGLLAGPEGLGKSTVAVTLGAQITLGTLPGEHHGTSRSVLVAATEDSFEHTIAPRFLAAGADLARVHRIEVRDGELTGDLNLPEDIDGVERAAAELDAVMLLMDPLISRLDPRIDTHKDAETRRGLEPVARLADRTGMVILGVIHFNKTGSTDPMQRVMASKAFAAVARSVSTVIKDPDDEGGLRRYLGTPKNNLGRSDLASLAFTIEPFTYDTDDGPGETGKIVWQEESAESIADLMGRASEDRSSKQKTIIKWLHVHLTEHGESPAADIIEAANSLGFGERALQRAAKTLGVVKRRDGFGGPMFWRLGEGSPP